MQQIGGWGNLLLGRKEGKEALALALQKLRPSISVDDAAKELKIKRSDTGYKDLERIASHSGAKNTIDPEDIAYETFNQSTLKKIMDFMKANPGKPIADASVWKILTSRNLDRLQPKRDIKKLSELDGRSGVSEEDIARLAKEVNYDVFEPGRRFFSIQGSMAEKLLALEVLGATLENGFLDGNATISILNSAVSDENASVRLKGLQLLLALANSKIVDKKLAKLAVEKLLLERKTQLIRKILQENQ